MAKSSGERPDLKITPDSVLALHDAGYKEADLHITEGLVLDIGCGLGFETARLEKQNRYLFGIDYDFNSIKELNNQNFASIRALAADCLKCPFKDSSFNWVVSSHIIEHFLNPALHLNEIKRILTPEGSAVIITPNKDADFENPFHLYLFEKESLMSLLKDFFESVEILGLDCKKEVKAEINLRRKKAQKVYNLDVFNLRKKMPRKWWIYIYSNLLPVAQRIVYKNSMGGKTGISQDDFFLTENVDETTIALFALAKHPKK